MVYNVGCPIFCPRYVTLKTSIYTNYHNKRIALSWSFNISKIAISVKRLMFKDKIILVKHVISEALYQ